MIPVYCRQELILLNGGTDISNLAETVSCAGKKIGVVSKITYTNTRPVA
jgi:hypothetical protein